MNTKIIGFMLVESLISTQAFGSNTASLPAMEQSSIYQRAQALISSVDVIEEFDELEKKFEVVGEILVDSEQESSLYELIEEFVNDSTIEKARKVYNEVREVYNSFGENNGVLMIRGNLRKYMDEKRSEKVIKHWSTLLTEELKSKKASSVPSEACRKMLNKIREVREKLEELIDQPAKNLISSVDCMKKLEKELEIAENLSKVTGKESLLSKLVSDIKNSQIMKLSDLLNNDQLRQYNKEKRYEYIFKYWVEEIKPVLGKSFKNPADMLEKVSDVCQQLEQANLTAQKWSDKFSGKNILTEDELKELTKQHEIQHKIKSGDPYWNDDWDKEE